MIEDTNCRITHGKYCTALSKDYFSAGILSSQMSESTNNHQLDMFFFGIFNITIKNWRINERNDEFQCQRVKPNSSLHVNGLVKHAAEVYTLTLFNICKKFEECGMLCWHYIWILQINCVQTIPDIYIHTRWTKNAKTTTWARADIGTSIPWRHQMARKTYNLILESKKSEEARKILEEDHGIDSLVVKALTSKKNPTNIY
ncbi:hypothetical protein ACS0TY_016808 [Phlomoides rotata]